MDDPLYFPLIWEVSCQGESYFKNDFICIIVRYKDGLFDCSNDFSLTTNNDCVVDEVSDFINLLNTVELDYCILLLTRYAYSVKKICNMIESYWINVEKEDNQNAVHQKEKDHFHKYIKKIHMMLENSYSYLIKDKKQVEQSSEYDKIIRKEDLDNAIFVGRSYSHNLEELISRVQTDTNISNSTNSRNLNELMKFFSALSIIVMVCVVPLSALLDACLPIDMIQAVMIAVVVFLTVLVISYFTLHKYLKIDLIKRD